MNALEIDNGDDLRELYRELILDHARNPRHFGKLADASHTAAGINPLCGDKLHLYLQVDTNDTITAACFEGSGCAISVASASLLTEAVTGMQTSDALDLFAAVNQRMTKSHSENDTGVDLGKIVALEGVRAFPSRIKCATLAWHALKSALRHQTSPTTTE